MDISMEAVIEKSGTPVSLPHVYLEMNRLIDLPDSTLADIAKVAEEDLGLTTRILKIVNSPYYGFPSTIDSISRAVAILGTKDLRDLVLTTTTLDIFTKMKFKHDHIQEILRHSLFCAVNARLLAIELHQPQTECFFVAGLMHDIGRLILLQALPESSHMAISEARTTGQDLDSIEQDIFGFTHSDIGNRLAELWHLPENVKEVIAFHHNPGRSRHFPLQTAVVHLADNRANLIDKKSSLVSNPPPVKQEALNVTSLSLERIDELLKTAPDHFKEVNQLFMNSDVAA